MLFPKEEKEIKEMSIILSFNNIDTDKRCAVLEKDTIEYIKKRITAYIDDISKVVFYVKQKITNDKVLFDRTIISINIFFEVILKSEGIEIINIINKEINQKIENY